MNEKWEQSLLEQDEIIKGVVLCGIETDAFLGPEGSRQKRAVQTPALVPQLIAPILHPVAQPVASSQAKSTPVLIQTLVLESAAPSKPSEPRKAGKLDDLLNMNV